MITTGVATTRSFQKQALAQSAAIRPRSRPRLHALELEALWAQVDRLRLYVATLFQILIVRGRSPPTRPAT